MPKKTPYGKYIISAGEIGAYTVCPESWRLRMIEKVSSVQSNSVGRGMELHEQWVKGYDEALYFSRAAKGLILLALLTILIYCLAYL